MIETDVLIVGAGPAGSACAWKLRQLDIDCLVVDQQAFPRFKPCAGWIQPAVLKDLDISPAEYPYGLQKFDSLYFSIRGARLRIPTRQYAIRRMEFDDWLLKRSDAPFQVHAVKDIKAVADGYLVDGLYRCRYLVGAGGTYCPVRRNLFHEVNLRCKDDLIVAMEAEFPYNWDDDRCQLWFLENHLPGYAWYVPKAGGIVNIGVGGGADLINRRGSHIQTHWRLLEEKLERLGLVRGDIPQPSAHTYYLRSQVSQIRVGNAFLIGDALGLATRDMGEGIQAAVKSGLRAAAAISGKGEYHLNGIARNSFLPW